MDTTQDKYEDWDITNLTGKQGADVVYGNTYQFKTIEDNIEDTSRWDENHVAIVQDLVTGKYYRTYYCQGLTEMQENRAFKDEYKAEFIEVFETEVTVKKFSSAAELATNA